MMILWANLIADIPPALALGIDNESIDIMARKPRNPKTGVFTKKSAFVILYNGLSMAVIALVVYIIAIYPENYEVDDSLHEKGPAKALCFISLTVTQLLHSFHAKSVKQTIFSKNTLLNKVLIIAVGCSLVLVVAVCYIPGLNDILDQYPLRGVDWAKVLACVAVHLIFMETFKFFYRWRARIKAEKKKDQLFFTDL